jgi:hypothetical protein
VCRYVEAGGIYTVTVGIYREMGRECRTQEDARTVSSNLGLQPEGQAIMDNLNGDGSIILNQILQT